MHIRFDVLALLLTVLLGCVLAAYVVHQHPAAGPAVLTAIGEQCALPGGAHFCHGGVHTTSRGFGKYLSARVALLDPQVGVVHSRGRRARRRKRLGRRRAEGDGHSKSSPRLREPQGHRHSRTGTAPPLRPSTSSATPSSRSTPVVVRPEVVGSALVGLAVAVGRRGGSIGFPPYAPDEPLKLVPARMVDQGHRSW